MSTGEARHRILVVEDEAMVGMLLEDMVLDSGGEVIGPVARFEEALALARTAEFDVAILDLNLHGRLSHPIAEAVRSRGLPIIFATGYGGDGLLANFQGYPTLRKPFSQDDLAQAITTAVELSPRTSQPPRRSPEG